LRELDGAADDIRKHVDDESDEVAPVGLRIALFERGERRGGAADVVYADEEGALLDATHRAFGARAPRATNREGWS